MSDLFYILKSAFSHLCGQGRPFIVDGAALPVCQRCFGLYAGAALTGAWLLVSGIRRRGLPHTGAVLADAAMLLAAMAGGLHLVDAGPAWRLVCGLWTGHVAVLWLAGSTGHLGRLARRPVPPDLPWPARDQVQALATGPVLAGLGLLFARFVDAGWHVWAALVVVGAATLLLALGGAVVALGRWAAVTTSEAWHTWRKQQA